MFIAFDRVQRNSSTLSPWSVQEEGLRLHASAQQKFRQAGWLGHVGPYASRVTTDYITLGIRTDTLCARSFFEDGGCRGCCRGVNDMAAGKGRDEDGGSNVRFSEERAHASGRDRAK